MQDGKKSIKALVVISSLVGQPPLNIQTLFMNTNIIIPVAYLFQILPKFCKEIRCLMTILHKPCKKKVMPLAVPIIKEEKLDTKIQYFNKNIVDTNYALLETPK